MSAPCGDESTKDSSAQNREVLELNSLVERLSLIKSPDEVRRVLEQTRSREQLLQLLLQEESLLKDLNKHTILEQAFNDESSAVCVYCNALLPKARMQIHLDLWCSAQPSPTNKMQPGREEAMEE